MDLRPNQQECFTFANTHIAPLKVQTVKMVKGYKLTESKNFPSESIFIYFKLDEFFYNIMKEGASFHQYPKQLKLDFKK